MNTQNYYRVSIKGIVIDSRGRILLSLEKNGMWDMLGGGLDHTESPEACLRREIAEEAGLTVTYISPAPLYFVSSKRLDAEYYMANVIYEIRLKDLDFTPSDECQELKFFSPEAMKEIPTFPNLQELLKLIDI